MDDDFFFLAACRGDQGDQMKHDHEHPQTRNHTMHQHESF
jgi:hypothetical protein